MLSRRTLVLGLLGVAGLLAWRYRLFQVCSFIVAAGVRKLVNPDPVPDFRELSPQWRMVEFPRNSEVSQSRGVITYHPWYHQFRPIIASRCLAQAAELGARYIRIDIRWKDVYPDGLNLNEDAWAWYDSYLTAALDRYGLRSLIVLSNAPEAIMQSSVSARLDAWARYVEEIARRVGRRCDLYQILNEPNNPVYRIFPAKMTPNAIHSAAEAIRKQNPNAKTTINVLCDLPGWLADLEDILTRSGSAVDIVGIDYYPSTWTVSSASVSSNWDRLVDTIVRRRDNERSPLHNRPVAILETGYSTNVSRWRGEEKQVAYFQLLGRSLTRFDQRIGQGGLLLVGVHELTDSDSRAGLDPEAHFGLVTSETLMHKASFAVVEQMFGTLG